MAEDLLAVAVEAARAGGRVLAGYFRDPSMEVEAKAAHDLVSEADRASEDAVLGTIRDAFPDHEILSEEAGWVGAAGGGREHRWIVDPLDGTSNFVQGLPVFAVSVACARGDQIVAGAVLDPLRDELFTATRGGGAFRNGRPLAASSLEGLEGSFLATGYPFRSRGQLDLYLAVFKELFHHARSIRRCGAAAIDLAYTAAGIYDGFFEFRLSPWDIAAGALLIEEAGGRITDLDGGPGYMGPGNVLAGGPRVHPELLRLAGRHVSEAVLAGG
ncbi:MAG: inositol monophosphatase family protein [Thermoanaerobaculia bacterium]|nr:inositol monophosphatase family protein [Thermoanaerobaculia bacterium]